jgi:hypothetical protein
MNTIQSKCLTAVAATIMLVSQAWAGQDWRRIEGTNIAVDMNSIDRRGDIAEFQVIDINSRETEYASIDCKAGTLITRHNEISISEKFQSFIPVYEKACKASWKFWE